MAMDEGKAMDGVPSEGNNVLGPSTPSSVVFRVNGLPESMNSIYQIIYSQRRVQMKPDVLRYKVQAKLYMPLWECEPEWLYGIKMQMHGDWWFKNGSARRIDLSNLEKIICDVTAEKYGFDDARIFEKYSWKVQNGGQSFVQVKIYRLLGDDLVDTGARCGNEKEARDK